MSEKEVLEVQFAQQQATLDQLWSGMESNLPTLKQIHGFADPAGIVTHYLAVLMVQVSQNLLRKRIDAL